jgi:ubiquinone/menaquinone biosynthesis C-methylase UbiE
VSQDFYEGRAEEKYPTSENPEVKDLVSRIVRWCQPRPGARILDVGCYDGYLLRELRRRCATEGVGIDISAHALGLAQSRAGGERTRFVLSGAVPLPFASEAFDVIVCSEILEHLPDLDGALAEIARVLVRGGRVYATMPNALDQVWPPLRVICRRVDRIEGHLRRLSREEFIRVMRDYGLEATTTRYRGFAASALWYSLLIYKPRVKRQAISMVSRKSIPSRLLRWLAFAGMKVYLAVDRQFSGYRGCMGIDAAFVKR